MTKVNRSPMWACALDRVRQAATRVDQRRYLLGPPELLVEITHTAESIDLHGKGDDYGGTGVLEYLVVCLQEQELHWFDFQFGGLLRPTRRAC